MKIRTIQQGYRNLRTEALTAESVGDDLIIELFYRLLKNTKNPGRVIKKNRHRLYITYDMSIDEIPFNVQGP